MRFEDVGTVAREEFSIRTISQSNDDTDGDDNGGRCAWEVRSKILRSLAPVNDVGQLWPWFKVVVQGR
jgi:hypothetical protein